MVDEADLIASDAGPLVIGQYRGRTALDIDVAMVRMFEQAGDMQQRRLTGARGRYQRNRLLRPRALVRRR